MERDEFLAGCVFLDLEVNPQGQLYRVGAVCGDDTYQKKGRIRADRVLGEVDRFVSGTRARYLAGHNLLQHDWQIVRQLAPRLKMLQLPVVDTLLLSPLAFPENPYHHLVKDYKLVRDAVNDPVADSRLSARLLGDEWDVFADRAARGDVDPLSFYRGCFVRPIDTPQGKLPTDGLVAFFDRLGGKPLDFETAQAIFDRQAAGRTCRSAAGQMVRSQPAGIRRAALAYAFAWLPVAGGNSVLPPWVRLQFPEVPELIRQLRERPCGDPDCEYCREVHDPPGQLRRYFGFDQFRSDPVGPDGSGLQEAIVRRGLGDQPLLAILPTGGGKSLCYQLPALVRNFRRGVLTIVLSPLQALMKDQVDNLVARIGCPAAAINGLLTPPERGQVLDDVRLGNVGILYLSPEQLRSKSTTGAIKQREIGCWVFDEAHCLSKWGHDFRPDYLYASRFIRELAAEQHVPVPPVACFTATAKRDVVEEIVQHFQNELGQRLEVFQGGVERHNLNFEVQPTPAPEKFSRVHELLAQRLGETGAAIIYTATRKTAERLSEYLVNQGWESAAFHAGLSSPIKRQIQEQFIGGETRVICATNAFGMGIDKEDVRMVVHADMPGSLENYLQEAGRAGRDRAPAECVLLYGEEDAETQFALSAISQLTPRDISQILRGLRRARRKSEVLVITSGELLRDDDVETTFDTRDNMADTKVKTAVAWLERAGFLERDHNATFVFQGKPRVANMEEAEEKLNRLGLPPEKRRQWLEVLQELINVDGPEGLNADHLAEMPAFYQVEQRSARRSDQSPSGSEQVLRTLDDMSRAGLVRKGVLLSAYVRHKVADHARQRLDVASQVESALLKLMQEQAPDATDQDWLDVSLRHLNQTLKDQGLDCNPDLVRRLLASLSIDGKGFGGSYGSLDFRHSYGDHYRVKLRRDWPSLIELSEKRRNVAAVVLRAILDKIPPGTPAAIDLLIEFSSEDLTRAVESDLALRGQLKDPLAAIDRGLMYLHEQNALVLQKGLSIFRQAMTIRLSPDAKGRRYTKGDFDPLQRHYQERILQVHVMCEYARRGVESIKDGLQMVLSYFSDSRSEFVAHYFGDKTEVIERAIGQEAYQQIVDDLRNPVQQAVVAAPDEDNLLILAGPGSGKTRAVVHRVAYLLRVQRVRPHSVLVLCFNRLAAIQLKRRLRELVGPSAARVTVLTYHALAARLTGTSFAERVSHAGDQPLDLADLIPAATRILRGEESVAGLAPDETRDRLLAGYRFVLVDEYQDIDQQQYDLISALTDRTGTDPDAKLSILAVGDDDQNIYAFRGTNVAYIRRFQEDFHARCHYLLENYRSTAHIIAAANQLISRNRDRMKTRYPIRINQARAGDPPGGRWQQLDRVGQGKVQVLQLPSEQDEPRAVVSELQRLKHIDQDAAWSAFAVLARTREALHPIRAACEHLGIPVVWALEADRAPRLHRVREIGLFLDSLRPRAAENCRASRLRTDFESCPADGNPWHEVVASLLEDWQDETADSELPISHLIDYVYESLAEQRREQRVGRGVFMSTVHAAKGMEFDHVIIPATGWTSPRPEEAEEERRLYYVAMTRARQTLCLVTPPRPPHPHARLLDGKFLLRRTPTTRDDLPAAVLGRRYELISLQDIDVGHAGSRAEGHPIHVALAELQPGSALKLQAAGKGAVLVDSHGRPVARLSRAGSERYLDRMDQISEVRVVAMLRREQSDEQPEFRDRCRSPRWEVPLAEVVWPAPLVSS